MLFLTAFFLYSKEWNILLFLFYKFPTAAGRVMIYILF